jgi:hypothetical protein
VVDCTATTIDTIAPGASRRFHFNMDWDFSRSLSAGGIGRTITSGATVDPGAAIAEAREENNTDSEVYRVLAPDLNIRQDCTPPETFLKAGTAWTCQIRVQNRANASAPAVILPNAEALFSFTFNRLTIRNLTTPRGIRCAVSSSSSTSTGYRCNAAGLVVIPAGGEIVFRLEAVIAGNPGNVFDSTVTLLVPNQSYRLIDFATLRSPEESTDQGGNDPHRSTQGGFVDFG